MGGACSRCCKNQINDKGMDKEIEVVCLQRHPEFYEDCIKLLNSEWPRSSTARLRKIEQGKSDGIPCNLVMVRNDTRGQMVIGHSKVQSLPYQSNACFVESVVIHVKWRRKGLGKILMTETEKFLSRYGINVVYLTTHDQQEFYRKLGYNYCEPIVQFGGSELLNRVASRLGDNKQGIFKSSIHMTYGPATKNQEVRLSDENDTKPKCSIPNPPPSPCMPIATFNNGINNWCSNSSQNKSFMQKVLSECPNE